MSELAELPIAPPPGVVKSDSLRTIEGRWSDSANMRFVKNLPQKIGGWVKGFVTATLGTPRSLHAWRDSSFNPYLAAGSYIKLYVYDPNGVQNDITPFRLTGTFANNPLATTNGSPVITVTHVAHGLSPGDLIYIAGSAAIGGITPNISQVAVATIIDADHYTYVFTSNATSTVGAGGGAAVTYQYEIPIGVELGAYGLGWGVGYWGLGTWGSAHSSSTIFIEPRVWSLDHFGKLLLASYNGGAIYQFDPTAVQPWGRATVVDATGPTNCRAMFVTPERFVMALLDSMQVAWASQGTLVTWTPAVGNTANVRTLTEGTKLVTGRVLADFVSLVWTDAALYRFQYTGSSFVYSSSMVAKDCGAISPNGCITVGGVAYWIGQDTFWTYSGTVTPMPNVDDIRKFVFDTLRTDYGYQCSAIYNPKYDEIWFFYTPTGQSNPSLGVIFSRTEQCWAPLYYGRCGGTHFTQGDTRPYMGDPTTFLLYQHENGYDADGVALAFSATLAPYAMSKGGRFNMMVEYIVPDFFQQTGDLTLTFTSWDRLNDSVSIESESETVIATDSGTIDLRISGRYVALLIAGGTALGAYVRLGQPVAFVKPMGDRG
jgi:hypothetical protein